MDCRSSRFSKACDMVAVRAAPGRIVKRLDRGWEASVTEPGACPTAVEARQIRGWISAPVPGTVAQARREAGLWTLNLPAPLHGMDSWYRLTVQDVGSYQLKLHGLATIAEVWFDGTLVLSSDNMFVEHELPLILTGQHELLLCFRALLPALNEVKGRRARWRPAIANPPSLRLIRTTLLGHMPGWCPPVHAVGPWRPIELVAESGAFIVEGVNAKATFDGRSGTVSVDLTLRGAASYAFKARLCCDDHEVAMHWSAPDRLRATLSIESAEPWWPHTHGEPRLYNVAVTTPDGPVELGRVGFRTLSVDRGSDGRRFGLRVNGEPVFCRGGCWTSADIVKLTPTQDVYRSTLSLVRDAAMNMIRVGGTGVYESSQFYEMCDEMGIMIWQDFMFANFDYPISDPRFVQSVKVEVRQVLDRIQLSPSLTILCGGSEVGQQAAMLGLPEDHWSSQLFSEILPELAREMRPDVPFVENSPSGGALPFIANSGVSHYYGVGAYLLPLEDARRSNVSFASECLAFSNVPESSEKLGARFGLDLLDRGWKQRIPRDLGASWDFEDVRDHYLALLYQVDPMRLRKEDPNRYLELSRAVVADVVEATFSEWRRDGSPTGGGLIWTLQDLWDGAGWGVIAADRAPKSSWYILRQVLAPIFLGLSDEGVNGLDIHWRNETDRNRSACLTFTCMRADGTPIRQGEKTIDLSARSVGHVNAANLIGSFFDVTYVYRFGPAHHDVNVAALRDGTSGEILARAFHFPLGRCDRRSAIAIGARLQRDNHDWHLALTAERVAQRVHIDDARFLPVDNWFHLLPGEERFVPLRARAGHGSDAPSGTVQAINSSVISSYGIET
jgi:beta-mannosidase